MPEPENILNDDFAVRASGPLLLAAAVFQPITLSTSEGRSKVRTMARKLEALCDYWEGQQSRYGVPDA